MVRHGHFVFHVATVREAAELHRMLTESTASGASHERYHPACPVSTQGLLLKAQSAAAHILDLLVKRFPEMKAPAIYNLSTALRISDVRKLTSAVCLRDASLERHLKYIADAADAARHLSEAIIDESVQALAGCLEARTVPAVMPAVRDLIAEHHVSHFSSLSRTMTAAARPAM